MREIVYFFTNFRTISTNSIAILNATYLFQQFVIRLKNSRSIRAQLNRRKSQNLKANERRESIKQTKRDHTMYDPFFANNFIMQEYSDHELSDVTDADKRDAALHPKNIRTNAYDPAEA